MEARKKMKSDRMFNTNNDDEGDEILTHRGKSLADLERMESPVEVRLYSKYFQQLKRILILYRRVFLLVSELNRKTAIFSQISM